MSYPAWKPYVAVTERRSKAEQVSSKAHASGVALRPIAPLRGAIAKTFWGKAWCANLERYSDFANRLPRGRSYLRAGSVIDLAIEAGEVRAQVVGSALYHVEVSVKAVPEKHWRDIGGDCAGSIDSMVELLQGRISQAVMQRLCRPGDGLFPAPAEIAFQCSCPDWASMCKHVAAVLYGVGARLDQQPELIFLLRRVDARDLLSHADTGLAGHKNLLPSARLLKGDLSALFGIEIVDVAPPVATKSRKAVKGSNAKVQEQKRSGAKR